MRKTNSQILIAFVCLILGIMLVTQFNTQRAQQKVIAQSPGDQATYISDLYQANENLQSELDELKAATSKYETEGSSGSNLVDLLDDLHRLRMATGAVEITGPGVAVTVSGVVSVQTLQDLVNELRNAGAEGIAINGVRLITRSVVGEDAQGVMLVDGQTIAVPYKLDAIGDSHTLAVALQRKGGLISQILASQGSEITIKVDERSEKGSLITLPRSVAQTEWEYARPVE